MTNTLIRRLINCGYEPENAKSLCFVYIDGSSLSVLDELISKLERSKNDVDKVQSESDRKKHR